jgi:hypothetical protein
MATPFAFHHRVVDAEKAREYLSRVGETLAPCARGNGHSINKFKSRRKP